MHLSTAEILLTLRSPKSGWLGVLATILDEANHDSSFDATQREALHQLLSQRQLPHQLGDAARRRAELFETETTRNCHATHTVPETSLIGGLDSERCHAVCAAQKRAVSCAPQRHELTLVGKMVN